jgi:hypothetical protein
MTLRKIKSYVCSNKQSQERNPKGEGKTSAFDLCGVGQESNFEAKNGPGHIQSIPRESPCQKFRNAESCK